MYDPPDGHHLTCYRIEGPVPTDIDKNPIFVDLEDQFGEMTNVQVLEPRLLCVPTNKQIPGGPLDRYEVDTHFKCYQVGDKEGQPLPRFDEPFPRIGLSDQFQTAQQDDVIQPIALCNPVLKFPHDPDTGDLPIDPDTKEPIVLPSLLSKHEKCYQTTHT